MNDEQAELARLRLLARAFDLTNDAILITDVENRIIAVNPAFTRMTGYSAAEVMGKNPRLLASGRTSRETYTAMWQGLLSEGTWQGEVWDRRADGESYPKWMHITIIPDAAGRVQNYLATFTDISEIKSVEEQITHLAQHDALTGLINRIALEGQFQRAMVGAERDRHHVAVLFIDLDNFKQINDSLGHQIGDQLLVQVAKRLTECVRASDIVARFGGDEFVVIVPAIDHALSVSAIASKIRHGMEHAFYVGEHTLYSTSSIGISLYPADGENMDTLVKNADAAMYHAKASGRNCFAFFAQRMNEVAQERLKFENALRSALELTDLNSSPQFQLYFQPQIDSASGRISGLEALARWFHPELGMIPPMMFIPIAEQTGLIQPLGDWVFWEACRQLREFKNQGMTDVRMAVNLSTQQLRNENLPAVIHGALACYELSPTDLELEITESTAMQNPEFTIAILTQLDDLGIVLAIDDFGTGYSSLAYLKHLPIHRLKLDRSFVKDIAQDSSDAAICNATIVLGHNLGLDLVAEGVETEAQRDYLKALKCDIFQGFLYSKPLPANEVADFVIRWNANCQR